MGLKDAERVIKKIPVETVKLEYKKPIYTEQVIGEIPQDTHIHKSVLQDSDIKDVVGNKQLYKPVIADVPVMNEGGVVYREVNEEVSGHGKPVVEYETEEVKVPVFRGYRWEISADDASVRCLENSSKDSCRADVNGYDIKFYPNIEYRVVDTYQRPKVRFENNVDILGHTIKWAIGGAVVGGVVGAILGAIYGVY